MKERPIDELIAAARDIKRVYDSQREYTEKLQALAAEALRTGQNLSHRIPAPIVHDYSTPIERLVRALGKIDKDNKRV